MTVWTSTSTQHVLCRHSFAPKLLLLLAVTPCCQEDPPVSQGAVSGQHQPGASWLRRQPESSLHWAGTHPRFTKAHLPHSGEYSGVISVYLHGRGGVV